ncbi:MAG: MBOAT family protein [Bacteroidales bacterium]|nr:MBOAT family protein [Bacteroidales bacterium]
MQFNSLSFAVFLPIVFLLYWFVFNRHVRWQNLFVVAASYLFYGMWDWRFLFLIAFTSLCSWGSGLLIGRYRAGSPKKAKLLSALNIVVNLLILGVFKYYNFFATAFADLFLHGQSDGLLLHVILPVGISFYTFQALSYSIDVYRGKLEPVRDIVQFFAYVSFFPQLVAGPIERATNLLPQFGKQRTFSYDQAVDGLRQMLWGLFKKMAIADNCAVFVDEVFGNHTAYDGASLALAAVLFAFQIYADFSGYSDIAIGVAKLFGIKLMRNFNNPYFSRDIAEFWRRWHISLTTWFRDYVYIPLGGSRTTKAKIVRNTLIIFLVSGFWHGANWTFIAWGAFHALLFLPLILAGRNRKYTDTVAVGRWLPSWKECLQMTLTFLLVVVGWIFFRADTISMAASYLCGLLGPWHNPFNMKMLPVLFYIAVMMTVEWFQRDKQHGLDLQHVTSHFVKFTIYYILIFIIFIAQKGSETFIYFQF